MNSSNLRLRITGTLTVAALCGGSLFQSAHAGYWEVFYKGTADYEQNGTTAKPSESFGPLKLQMVQMVGSGNRP